MDNFTRQIHRRAQPVIVMRPILGKCVDATGTRLIKPRIEQRDLGIVGTSEPITGMGTP